MNRSLPAAALVLLALAALPAPATAQRTPLSPRDTARLELADGAVLMVDYGRPAMRGRRIMGELVPWDRVWRTGANAATGFATAVDLRLGDAGVPRGSYTLYTLPSPGDWTLIVSRQTGQWGTQYDPSRDLVRIPLTEETLDEPVERFTIRFVPEGEDRGLLVMEWERTRLTVPFEVAARS